MEYESRVRGLGLPQSARDKGGEMALLMVQGALDFKSIEEPLSEGQIVSFKPKFFKKNGLVVIKSEKINIDSMTEYSPSVRYFVLKKPIFLLAIETDFVVLSIQKDHRNAGRCEIFITVDVIRR
mgnify:FL=1